MSENEAKREVVEVRHLWGLAVKLKPEDPWMPFGTEVADAAAALRTYDFGVNKHPELEHQLRKITVTVELENVEELRERIAQASAENENSDVHSE